MFDPLKYVLIGFLRLYRLLISPIYGPVCRYYPSCSAYALEAVTVHGSIRGSWLTIKRLLRCNPWSLGGVDKVPPRHPRGQQITVQLDHQPDPSIAVAHPEPTIKGA